MADLLDDERVTIRQSGTIAVVTHRDAWAWRCNECGWLGTGHFNDVAALREASAHFWTEHQVALCASIDDKRKYGHPGHVWHHVQGTDSINKCDRCGEHSGK